MKALLPPFFDGEELLYETEGSVFSALLLGFGFICLLLGLNWIIDLFFDDAGPYRWSFIVSYGFIAMLYSYFGQPEYVAVTTRRIYLKRRFGQRFSVLFPEIRSLRKTWAGIELTSSRRSKKVYIHTVPQSGKLFDLIQQELPK